MFWRYTAVTSTRMTVTLYRISYKLTVSIVYYVVHPSKIRTALFHFVFLVVYQGRGRNVHNVGANRPEGKTSWGETSRGRTDEGAKRPVTAALDSSNSTAERRFLL